MVYLAEPQGLPKVKIMYMYRLNVGSLPTAQLHRQLSINGRRRFSAIRRTRFSAISRFW